VDGNVECVSLWGLTGSESLPMGKRERAGHVVLNIPHDDNHQRGNRDDSNVEETTGER